MNILGLFRRPASAPVARDRLQILLAHERVLDGRTSDGKADLVATLQEEILAVIARYVPIDREKVKIKLDRDGGTSMLEIDVEMPERPGAAEARGPGAGKSAAGGAGVGGPGVGGPEIGRAARSA